MTVKDLIWYLQQMPENAVVYRLDGDYRDSEICIREVKLRKDAGWGVHPNTVLID